jgi:hypothetical protein
VTDLTSIEEALVAAPGEERPHVHRGAGTRSMNRFTVDG